MDCLFCKIVKGEVPSYRVYEDEQVLCFLEIHPESNGETLIIPKKHVKDFYELDDDLSCLIKNVTTSLMKRMEEVFHADGFTVIQNNGCAQEIKHFHVHLVPKYQDEQELRPIEEVWKEWQEAEKRI